MKFQKNKSRVSAIFFAITITLAACGQKPSAKAPNASATTPDPTTPASTAPTPDNTILSPGKTANKPLSDGMSAEKKSEVLEEKKPTLVIKSGVNPNSAFAISICDKSGWLQKLMIDAFHRKDCKDFTSADLNNVVEINQPEIPENEKKFTAKDFIDFTSLIRLDLSNQQITGTIPSELGKLTQLEFLILNQNQFTGTIPKEIWTLLNLKTLSLASNQLAGVIPDEIGKLVNLKYLALSRNQFSGTILNKILTLKQLVTLILTCNQFSGEIPYELENLTHLYAYSFSVNYFTGDVPPRLRHIIHD